MSCCIYYIVDTDRRSRRNDDRRHHRRDRSPPSRTHRREYDRDDRDRKDRWNRSSGDHHRRNRSRSRSRSRSPRRPRNFPKKDNNSDNESYEWGKKSQTQSNSRNDGDKPVPEKEKEQPNFGLSGKLTEDTNTVNGVVVKYAEPPEARKPKRRWRLYPFKGDKSLPTMYIHRQSHFLIGRDKKVCHITVEHPSCSKQHAVLQYRLVPYEKDDGTMSKRVKPYVLDLESANGTFVNNNKIEPKRYHELLEKDVIKFGFSSREYVILHENSKDDDTDEENDVTIKSEPRH